MPASAVDVASINLYNELFRKRDLCTATLGMPAPVWSSTVATSVSLYTAMLRYVRFTLLLHAVRQSYSGISHSTASPIDKINGRTCSTCPDFSCALIVLV